MSVLVFLKESELSPAGGPLGVGYYIYQQVKSRNLGDQILFLTGGGTYSSRGCFLKSVVGKLPFIIKKNIRSLHRLLHFRNLLTSSLEINLNEYEAVHFHSTLDMWLLREVLQSYKGEVILTSHSPVPAFEEHESYCTTSIEKCWFRSQHKKLVNIDRFAFSRANYIVFPTEGAMDGYYNHWSDFKEIIADKPVKFIETGISPREGRVNRKDVLSELGLSDEDFIISFAGRHNTIKGYDLLKKLANELFKTDSQIKVIAAGNESPLTRLEHPSWKEIGFTNDPYSYISASDVLIVPNRETYFDLVILEGLSLGKIVLTSNTGGNRYFKDNDVPGVFLFNSLEEAQQLIYKIKSLSPNERKNLADANLEYYKNHLTIECFFNSYWAFLSEIGVVR